MIQDPAAEIFDAVRRSGDEPSEADRQRVALVRRRFGLALPPPFTPVPPPGDPIPIRTATPADAAALASVRWRSWQVAYAGLLPPADLAAVPAQPPMAEWISTATVPPTTRHHLLVAGRPGTVLAMAQVRPTRDPDQDPSIVSEVHLLYLDPLVQRRGIGRSLLAEAGERADRSGATRLSLWAVVENAGARSFYEGLGWIGDGSTHRNDFRPGVGLTSTRYWRPEP